MGLLLQKLKNTHKCVLTPYKQAISPLPDNLYGRPVWNKHQNAVEDVPDLQWWIKNSLRSINSLQQNSARIRRLWKSWIFCLFFFFIDKASTFINCEEAFQKHDSQLFLSHRCIKRNIREDNWNYSNTFLIFSLPNSWLSKDQFMTSKSLVLLVLRC